MKIRLFMLVVLLCLSFVALADEGTYDQSLDADWFENRYGHSTGWSDMPVGGDAFTEKEYLDLIKRAKAGEYQAVQALVNSAFSSLWGDPEGKELPASVFKEINDEALLKKVYLYDNTCGAISLLRRQGKKLDDILEIVRDRKGILGGSNEVIAYGDWACVTRAYPDFAKDKKKILEMYAIDPQLLTNLDPSVYKDKEMVLELLAETKTEHDNFVCPEIPKEIYKDDKAVVKFMVDLPQKNGAKYKHIFCFDYIPPRASLPLEFKVRLLVQKGDDEVPVNLFSDDEYEKLIEKAEDGDRDASSLLLNSIFRENRNTTKSKIFRKLESKLFDEKFLVTQYFVANDCSYIKAILGRSPRKEILLDVLDSKPAKNILSAFKFDCPEVGKNIADDKKFLLNWGEKNVGFFGFAADSVWKDKEFSEEALKVGRYCALACDHASDDLLIKEEVVEGALGAQSINCLNRQLGLVKDPKIKEKVQNKIWSIQEQSDY